MVAVLLAPHQPTQFADVPFAQAALEELRPLGAVLRIGQWAFRCPSRPFPFRTGAIRVRGWMLLPDGPFSRIHAFVNGEEFFTCKPEQREDLAAAYSHIPDAGRAQFSFEIPSHVARKGRIELVGKRSGRPMGRMQFRFRNDLQRKVPMPPARLTRQVVDTVDPQFFLAQGYKSFDEINGALIRHRPIGGIDRLLDWGCGCGRLAAHWLRERRIPEVHGCDINGEAIEWCRTHLLRGRFAVVAFDPPTAYPDQHFDAIAAFSVFTHLTKTAQLAWLAEMHRILRPGGIFAASVHGPSAAWFRFGPRIHDWFQGGIHDETTSFGNEEIVVDGAYRNTYQTPEYTRAAFGRWFDVLEYTERGVGNAQDLIVLRKRD